jgi:hypothetical protein
VACFIAAAAAIVGAVLLFDTGFAGPAPLALGGAGALIAGGVTLWRGGGPKPGRGPYPRE